MSLPMRWDEIDRPESVTPPLRSPHRRRRELRFSRVLAATGALALGLTVLCLAGVGASTAWRGLAQDSDLRLIANGQKGVHVAMMAPSVERRLGFVTVTGSVSNRATVAQHEVEAVVELLDRGQHTVQMESALIAFDPLGPGQTAPFHVEIPDDSRAVGYRVRFKKLSGEELD